MNSRQDAAQHASYLNRLSAVGPAIAVVPITPDDDNDLPQLLRGIRAHTAGTLVCDMAGKDNCTLRFNAGETRHGLFVKIYATGTTITASDLEGIV